MTDFLIFFVVLGVVLFAIYKTAADDHPLKVALVAIVGAAAPFADKLLDLVKGWLA